MAGRDCSADISLSEATAEAPAVVSPQPSATSR
jgi:hypothetical protein